MILVLVGFGILLAGLVSAIIILSLMCGGVIRFGPPPKALWVLALIGWVLCTIGAMSK